MKEVLSPKELAAAIGVSESSLRRWVDAGLLQTSRTAGGHRRIPLADAVRFIRESHATVVRPELLGFAPLTTPPSAPQDTQTEYDRLCNALLSGDAALSRGIVFSLYLTGSPLTGLFDGPLAACMHRVGELYLHSPKGILIEHRATDIALQILAQLRQMLPTPPDGAPLAVGGAPSDDIYLLPSQMAAATLTEAGYVVYNFGPEVPLDTLALAAEDQRPRLVYLSLTSATAVERIRREDVYALADRVGNAGSLLVVGGQQLPRLQLAPHANLHPLASMAALSAFARGKLSPPAAPPAPPA